jgi:hypothetical protein
MSAAEALLSQKHVTRKSISVVETQMTHNFAGIFIIFPPKQKNYNSNEKKVNVLLAF